MCPVILAMVICSNVHCKSGGVLEIVQRETTDH